MSRKTLTPGTLPYLIPVLDIENGPLLYPPHDWATLVRHLQPDANP